MRGLEAGAEENVEKPSVSSADKSQNDSVIFKNKNLEQMSEDELSDEEDALTHLREELESQITEVTERLRKIGELKFKISNELSE